MPEYPLLPDGTYHFEIRSIEHKTSSKGREMYQVSLDCDDEDGNSKWVWDYVMADDSDWAVQKRYAFCAACGMDPADEFKDMPTAGQEGYVKIKSEDKSLKAGTEDEYWPAKNVVDEYVESVPVGSVAADDEVPF